MLWQAKDRDSMGSKRSAQSALISFQEGSHLLCLGIRPALPGDWIKAICMSVSGH